MSKCDHVAWLQLAARKTDYSIRYEDRFQRIASQMINPSSQVPSLAFFMGRTRKNIALREIFPDNNLTRRQRTLAASINLQIDNASSFQIDNASSYLDYPVLFADCDPTLQAILHHDQSSYRCHTNKVLPLPWEASVQHQLLDYVLSRLLFSFTDVIYLFIKDLSGLKDISILLSA